MWRYISALIRCIDTQTEENKEAEDIKEEYRIQWNHSVTQLRFLKEQQWRISHYTLLLFAAIFGASTILSSDNANIILAALSGIVWMASLIVLYSLENSLKKNREEIEKACKKGCSKEYNDDFPAYTHYGLVHDPIIIILYGAITIGFGIVIWLLVS